MFWGVSCESGKKYSQIVNASYHISMASLEPRDSSYANKHVSLMVEHKNNEFLVCTLEYNRILQVNLDLLFKKGEDVTFFLNGEGSVHLTGYVVEEEADMNLSLDEESEDEVVESNFKKKHLMDFEILSDSSVKKPKKAVKKKLLNEIKKGSSNKDKKESPKTEKEKAQNAKSNKLVKEKLSPLKKEKLSPVKKEKLSPAKKEKLSPAKREILCEKKKNGMNGNKKVNLSKQKDVISDEEEDDSLDEEEEDDVEEEEGDVDEEEEEEDVEEDKEDVEDEEEDLEEEEEDLEEEEEEEEEEEDEKEEQNTIKPTGVFTGTKRGNDVRSPNEAKRVKTDFISPSSKLVKKKMHDFLIIGEKEDLEDQDSDDSGEMNSSIGRTPMPPKRFNASGTPLLPLKLDMSQTPGPASKKKKRSKKKSKGEQSEQSQQPESSEVSYSKKLSSGVEIEDIRFGHGPVATPSRMVNINYIGKLANGEVFDTVKENKGHVFRLGRGEAIKGLEQGVLGMKVGGKRKIKVPPHMGYGNKGVSKVPPNSTLFFTVQLKAVS